VVDLLSHRLIFVTGKGGVGKTTVARALAQVAVADHKRVIVAELVGSEGTVERSLPGGVDLISINPQAAMEEYLTLKAGRFGAALGHSRLFGALTMATPGLRELLAIGKVWELAQLDRRSIDAEPYDLVVVDAPATGHGVASLRTPRVFADTARVGPVAERAGKIAATIADRSFTAIVAVALAEEMPVNETLALAAALEQDGLDLNAVFLNGRYAERFSDADAAAMQAALSAGQWVADGQADLGRLPMPETGALRAALSAHARAAAQAPHARRLAERFGAALIPLPYLFSDAPDLTDALTQALA
jgi:anion-transporting  ArsA/GET3 family ATPase